MADMFMTHPSLTIRKIHPAARITLNVLFRFARTIVYPELKLTA